MQLVTTSDDERAPPCKECAPAPRWRHFPVRTIEDVQRVCAATGIPDDLAGDALDLDELARIDHHASGAILVVLRAPVRHEPGGLVRTTALSVVVVRDSVVTMAAPELDIEPTDGAGSPRRVLAKLLLLVADRFIVELRAIDAAVNVLETELQASLRNSELRGLLMHQKSLVHFRTAIASNMILLERLEHDAKFRADDTEAELLDDAIVEMRQAAEMTRVSSDILGEMMDAFASIISNNLNVVMKVMAALTIVIAVPSLVAGLYGMNVVLPGQHSPAAFAVIATASVVVAAALVVLFRRIRWL